MTATAGLSRIGQIAVVAKDFERAVSFYRDTLQMKLLFTAPPVSPKLAFFDCDGVRLLVDLPEDKEFANHSSVIYFTVDDIQHMHETLASRGVTFRQGPHLIARLADREVWMAFFYDSEGNTMALMAEPRIQTSEV
jgi:predicted enzyme related to lactoylglutathione lyase